MGFSGITITDYEAGRTFTQMNHTVQSERTCEEFSNKVMKCVSSGGQKTALCSDALLSYASPQTGESVNIYRADNYSMDKPVYIIKVLDSDGNEFMQEVDASSINPNHCSYNELMVLNIETGHTSPSDYLHAVAVRERAGAGSYCEKKDYIAYAQKVMNEQKMSGNWTSYMAYGKWIQSLINYVALTGEKGNF